MRKHLRPLFAFLALTIVMLACAVPIPPVSLPTLSSGTATPPFSPEDVGTAVAMTLTAAIPGEEPGGTSPAETPGPEDEEEDDFSSLLPHDLYFIAPDDASITQVFRLEADGITQHQLTTEAGSVSDYDVSTVDGRVAYVANNQLLLVNADGTGRRILVDGGAVDQNNPFISTISSPVFSLDAQTLAYSYKGLQFYNMATGESRLLIENQIDDVGGGLFVPRELYAPERYSPDGTKLLVTLGYYEGASSAIYYPDTNALVRLTGGEGALICCEEVEWSADSASTYAASASAGMFSSGLWRVDVATGEVTTLLPGDAGAGNYNAAKEAYLAPDGQLYFFHAVVSSPEAMFNRAAMLQLVRSAPDGVTDRTALSTEDYEYLNEALWAPDASLLIAAVAPAPEVYQGGEVKIVYVDGRPNEELLPFAQQMKWGP
jgi:hypothetical protein